MGFTLWQVPSQDHIQAEVQGEQKLWIKEASKETGKKKKLAHNTKQEQETVKPTRKKSGLSLGSCRSWQYSNLAHLHPDHKLVSESLLLAI